MARSDEPRFQKRPDDRPGELLEAALAAFSEGGYRATSLAEVAARAGVSKGTIYLYFRNKEDLLLQALTFYLDTASRRSVEHVEVEPGSYAAKLAALLRKFWRVSQDPEWARVYRLVSGEIAAEHPAVFRRWAEAGAARLWQIAEQLVVEGQRTGEFRDDIVAAHVVPVLITGLVQQGYFQAHTVVGELAPVDPDEMFESVLRVFLHGITPPPR